jgi:hypothetical protein
MERARVEAMLIKMFEERDPDAEYAMRHPDFQADMPQSNERFASREALREMQRAFPIPRRSRSDGSSAWRAQWVESMPES